jgi:F-type H+-transporting ATPase subunit delta
MPRVTSGKWYAQAAFALALERDELEGWQKGLEDIAELTQNEALLGLLENPKVPFTGKKSLLEEQLGDIPPLVLHLALLLVTKNGLRLASDISRQYQLLLDAHQGIEHAEVTTAVPLSDKDRDLITRRIGEIVRRKVMLDPRVDPAVIGGFVARIGDMLIDGSIRQQLDTLKKNLVEVGRV